MICKPNLPFAGCTFADAIKWFWSRNEVLNDFIEASDTERNQFGQLGIVVSDLVPYATLTEQAELTGTRFTGGISGRQLYVLRIVDCCRLTPEILCEILELECLHVETQEGRILHIEVGRPRRFGPQNGLFETRINLIVRYERIRECCNGS